MTLVLRTINELREWRKTAPEPLGLVPTMGALHEGHLSLVKLSQERCRSTIASIFVNPLQFGPTEDFSAYPRTFEEDLSKLKNSGVDALFCPLASEVYIPDSSTYVVEEKVSEPLCGPFRPGHFRGVATVVLKLFNLVQPNFAFFGQKDAQQCAVIERMVRDLNVPVEVVRGPTLRESDGLAMSSRNVYLMPAERAQAPLIFQSMTAVKDAFQAGEKTVSRLVEIGRSKLETTPAFKIQYFEIRHPQSLQPIEFVGPEGALIAVAAYLGKTRLIDNERLS